MRPYRCPKTRAVRALWTLEELGVSCECVLIDVRGAKARADCGFRAVSPLGKVPALEAGTMRSWDSSAICANVAD